MAAVLVLLLALRAQPDTAGLLYKAGHVCTWAVGGVHLCQCSCTGLDWADNGDNSCWLVGTPGLQHHKLVPAVLFVKCVTWSQLQQALLYNLHRHVAGCIAVIRGVGYIWAGPLHSLEAP